MTGTSYQLRPAEDWYILLVDDCKAIITEAVFNSRQALIEGYHELGRRLVTDKDFQKHMKGNGETLTDLSNKCGVHTRDLYRAMQFYEKFPTIQQVETLPEGKNLSWNKIVTNYLPRKAGEQHDPLPHLRQALYRAAKAISVYSLSEAERVAVDAVMEAFE